MKRIICFAWIIAWFAGCTQIEKIGFGEKRHSIVAVTPRHASSPGAVRLNSGEVLAIYREGSGQFSPDGRILISRSANGGRIWSVPDTVIRSVWDCRNPSIAQLKDGLILINFFQVRYDRDGKQVGPIGVYLVRSFDNGVSYTSPRMIRPEGLDWCATSDVILELPDGKLILPVYGAGQGSVSKCVAAFSYDGGDTWSESATIASDPENRVGFQEPSLARLPGGRIVCMMRAEGAEGFLQVSHSDDDGKTWSEAVPVSIEGEAADLHVTREGILLCTYRDYWPLGISTRPSHDGGRSWGQEIHLWDEEDECADPEVIDLEEGLLALYGAAEPSDELKKSAIRGTRFDVRRPDPPGGFSVGVMQNKGVELRWNPVPGAVYYQLYRSTDKDFTIEQGYPFQGNGIATSTRNRFRDVDVRPGTVYYYRVTTVVTSGRPVPGMGSESEPSICLEAKVQ